MRFSFLAMLSVALLAPALARADDDAALEKRIEAKVVADHQKAVQRNKVAAKAKLDQKADRHENSVKSAASAKGKAKDHLPKKRPPGKKKGPRR